MRLDFFIAFWVVAVAAMAQQNVGFREGAVVSPQINEDNSVTFRLRADAAGHVTVIGDWAANGGRGEMTRNADGVWTYTTPVLPSEMYTYRLDVDGVVNLDPLNPFTRRDVGNVYSVFYIGGGCGDYYQVHDVPHGDVVTTWYHSDSAGADRRLSVYLPPCYGKECRKYPVLYLLHGSGGDETAWLDLGHVARIMDNLIARGEAEPMIVVMPNGNFSKQAAPGETPENLAFRPVMTNMLTDYKNGAYEMAFTEIIGFIDNKYSTIPDRQHRAIAGLSMGGFHSLYIALNYPGWFDYVGLFSAGLMTDLNTDREAYRDEDAKLARLSELGCKLFWIGIGKDDFLYEANTDFRKRLDSMDFDYIYHESERGHIWANWRQYLLLFVPQLFNPKQS